MRTFGDVSADKKTPVTSHASPLKFQIATMSQKCIISSQYELKTFLLKWSELLHTNFIAPYPYTRWQSVSVLEETSATKKWNHFKSPELWNRNPPSAGLWPGAESHAALIQWATRCLQHSNIRDRDQCFYKQNILWDAERTLSVCLHRQR